MKLTNINQRTCGGLGNQIFQILFGRLLSAQTNGELKVNHSLRYQHKFELSEFFRVDSHSISFLDKLMLSSRLPALLYRSGISKKGYIKFSSTFYLDSYFQDLVQFRIFDEQQIKIEILKIKEELQLSPKEKEPVLIHFRLGDFFQNTEQKIKNVKSRLNKIPDGAKFITNDEEIFNNKELKKLLHNKRLCMQSTIGWNAQEVLKFMCKFSHIEANDSTMVFWASIFSNSDVCLTDSRLSELQLFFKNILYTKI
jgi:hypothetical protein